MSKKQTSIRTLRAAVDNRNNPSGLSDDQKPVISKDNVVEMRRNKEPKGALEATCNGANYGNLWIYTINLKHRGQKKPRHKHEFDHLHLISQGKALFEVYGDDGIIMYSEEYTAPQWIRIPRMHDHQITALEDNTIGYCVHPMRNEDGTLCGSNYIEDILNDYKYTAPEELKDV